MPPPPVALPGTPVVGSFTLSSTDLRAPEEVVELLLYNDEVHSVVSAFVRAVSSGAFCGRSIHRVVPGFVVQGGRGVETSGAQPDFSERHTRTHSRSALVGVTKNLEFYVTLAAAPHLNSSHIVIGEVVSGMHVFREMEQFRTIDDIPVHEILIKSASIRDTDAEFVQRGVPNRPCISEGDVAKKLAAVLPFQYPEDANPPLSDSDCAAICTEVKGVGNALFSASDHTHALLCYHACLRYAALSSSGNHATPISERSKIYSNISACHLAQNAPIAARNSSREAVKLDSTNAKALYRYSLSLTLIDKPDIDAAWASIVKAYTLTEASDPGVNTLYASLKKRRSAGEKKLAQKMATWTDTLAADRPAGGVFCTDTRTGKDVVISAKSGGGITYALDGQDRGRVSKVVLGGTKTRTIAFPELRKAIALPENVPYPPKGFRTLCEMQGVEVEEAG